ncbi:MAG: endonuclease domain-containing protein [Opitutaceae bacterium]|nr:endonuclease domain-containing protein [Opitutaceae bacterium]
MKIRYNPKLKQLARELRNHSTLGEILLWRHLNQRQRRGYDFHRQKPVGNFIVDFYAPKLNLAVEIDGGTHFLKADRDAVRQQALESIGIHFLRYTEKAVRENPWAVARAIDVWIDAHPPVNPASKQKS